MDKETVILQANDLALEGKFQEACDLLHALLAAYPKVGGIAARLAETYWAWDQNEKAIYYYRHALQLRPSLTYAAVGLYRVLLEQGEQDEAINGLTQFLSLLVSEGENSGKASTTVKESTTNWQPKIKNKILHFRKRIEDEPNNPNLYQELGILYCETGDLNLAFEMYLEALKIDPKNSWTHLFRANWYAQIGELNAALACCEVAENWMPEDGTPIWRAAEILEELGRFDSADIRYRKALRLAPDDETVKAKYDEWCQRLLKYNAKKENSPPL